MITLEELEAEYGRPLSKTDLGVLASMSQPFVATDAERLAAQELLTQLEPILLHGPAVKSFKKQSSTSAAAHSSTHPEDATSSSSSVEMSSYSISPHDAANGALDNAKKPVRTSMSPQEQSRRRFTDLSTVIRYLRANNMKKQKAHDAIVETLVWREQNDADNAVCEICLKDPHAHTLRIVGYDAQCRPVLYTSLLQATGRHDAAGSARHMQQVLEEATKLFRCCNAAKAILDKMEQDRIAVNQHVSGVNEVKEQVGRDGDDGDGGDCVGGGAGDDEGDASVAVNHAPSSSSMVSVSLDESNLNTAPSSSSSPSSPSSPSSSSASYPAWQSHGQWVFIVDFVGYGFKDNNPMAGYLIKQMLAYYPERLALAVLVDAPFIFSGLWAVIRPMLDERTSKKVLFIKSKELYESRKQIPQHAIVAPSFDDEVGDDEAVNDGAATATDATAAGYGGDGGDDGKDSVSGGDGTAVSVSDSEAASTGFKSPTPELTMGYNLSLRVPPRPQSQPPQSSPSPSASPLPPPFARSQSRSHTDSSASRAASTASATSCTVSSESQSPGLQRRNSVRTDLEALQMGDPNDARVKLGMGTELFLWLCSEVEDNREAGAGKAYWEWRDARGRLKAFDPRGSPCYVASCLYSLPVALEHCESVRHERRMSSVNLSPMPHPTGMRQVMLGGASAATTAPFSSTLISTATSTSTSTSSATPVQNQNG